MDELIAREPTRFETVLTALHEDANKVQCLAVEKDLGAGKI